jgi:hypothetical protein
MQHFERGFLREDYNLRWITQGIAHEAVHSFEPSSIQPSAYQLRARGKPQTLQRDEIHLVEFLTRSKPFKFAL